MNAELVNSRINPASSTQDEFPLPKSRKAYSRDVEVSNGLEAKMPRKETPKNEKSGKSLSLVKVATLKGHKAQVATLTTSNGVVVSGDFDGFMKVWKECDDGWQCVATPHDPKEESDKLKALSHVEETKKHMKSPEELEKLKKLKENLKAVNETIKFWQGRLTHIRTEPVAVVTTSVGLTEVTEADVDDCRLRSITTSIKQMEKSKQELELNIHINNSLNRHSNQEEKSLRLKAHNGTVCHAIVFDGGQQIASVSGKPHVCIKTWKFDNNEKEYKPTAEWFDRTLTVIKEGKQTHYTWKDHWVQDMAALPQGGGFVTASVGGGLKLWSQVEGEWTRTDTVESPSCSVVAVSNEELVSGDYQGNVKTYNKVDGKWQCSATLKHGNHPVRSVAVSPDRQTILSTDGQVVKYWELKDNGWKCVAALSDDPNTTPMGRQYLFWYGKILSMSERRIISIGTEHTDEKEIFLTPHTRLRIRDKDNKNNWQCVSNMPSSELAAVLSPEQIVVQSTTSIKDLEVWKLQTTDRPTDKGRYTGESDLNPELMAPGQSQDQPEKME